MPDTFHGFPDLPPELRDAIWNQAIRPQRPGAQVFKYYTGPEDDDHANVAVKPTHPKAQHLAAPEYSESAGPSVYTKDNMSWYLYDGGMWSACKESRRVIAAITHDKSIGPKQGTLDAPMAQPTFSPFILALISVYFRYWIGGNLNPSKIMSGGIKIFHSVSTLRSNRTLRSKGPLT